MGNEFQRKNLKIIMRKEQAAFGGHRNINQQLIHWINL